MFCWLDEYVAKNTTFPKLIKNITDYQVFASSKDKECQKAIGSMVDNAIELKDIYQKPQESNPLHIVLQIFK